MDRFDRNSIGVLISSIARMRRTHFDQKVRALGVTRAQWLALNAIAFFEGLTQSRLAALLEVETVTAGRVIDLLEAADWVVRRPDASDRRLKRLYLTPAAAPLVRQMAEIAKTDEREALEGLSEAECLQLQDLLSRMSGNIATRLGRAPANEGALPKKETKKVRKRE
jgi:MarR family transcriptional regulator for hemolysin